MVLAHCASGNALGDAVSAKVFVVVSSYHNRALDDHGVRLHGVFSTRTEALRFAPTGSVIAEAYLDTPVLPPERLEM